MSVSVHDRYPTPTRTPLYPTSARRLCANASTPDLEAQYAVIIGAGVIAARDAICSR